MRLPLGIITMNEIIIYNWISGPSPPIGISGPVNRSCQQEPPNGHGDWRMTSGHHPNLGPLKSLSCNTWQSIEHCSHALELISGPHEAQCPCEASGRCLLSLSAEAAECWSWTCSEEPKWGGGEGEGGGINHTWTQGSQNFWIQIDKVQLL